MCEPRALPRRLHCVARCGNFLCKIYVAISLKSGYGFLFLQLLSCSFFPQSESGHSCFALFRFESS